MQTINTCRWYIWIFACLCFRTNVNKTLSIYNFLNMYQVDISTMLEEAVHYVKFLQLQIKVRKGFDFNVLRVDSCVTWKWSNFKKYFVITQLLSSDDQWMYAPIAFNGMDIGLNLPRWYTDLLILVGVF